MHFLKSKKRLAPIGRLDKNSTGLLLLTNDGDLHQYLTHPKNQIPRQYIVVIEKIIDSLKYGILNVHPGILPKYKGRTCVEWSIFNDDKVGIAVGVTKGLDGKFDAVKIISCFLSG